jgi:hypothetical protein
MQVIKLNGGSARAGQLMLLLIFTPILLFLCRIIFKNFSLGGIVFLGLISISIYLFLRNAFSYADLFLEDNTIVIKKLFTVRRLRISYYKKLKKALLPFTYYIEFEGAKKIFFFLPSKQLLQELSSLDSEKMIKEFRLKFEELKESDSNSSTYKY